MEELAEILLPYFYYKETGLIIWKNLFTVKLKVDKIKIGAE